MFYLVEKLSADHWKTVIVTRDRARADAAFAGLGAENLHAAFRLVVVRHDEAGNRVPEVLAERPAEIPPLPVAAPEAVAARRWAMPPLRAVNPLRAFVYGGLVLSFGIVLNDSFNYVLTRMHADAAEPAEGIQTQLVSQPSAPDRPILGGTARESLPPAEPVAVAAAAEPAPAEVEAEIEVAAETTEPPPVVPATPEPAAVPATAVPPAPPPMAAAPVAPAVDPAARAHAACRARVMERARFTARAQDKTDFRTTPQKGGRLRVEGKDLEFRNVFNEWVAVRYACEVDAGNGTIAKVEIKPAL